MTDSPANFLCKACGLCCSGHLFSWVRLNAPELDPIEKLGIKVIRDDPRQRGFTQPCPLWDGACTIYTSHAYPRSCAKYKCSVFRRLEDDDLSPPEALSIIQETLDMIREIEPLLPKSSAVSFRERLIAHKEELEAEGQGSLNASDARFLKAVDNLLNRYDNYFGVDDFIDYEQ
ncbi:MAG: hypothetical protein C4557_13305 [Anaerolineaceae bacterium]|jgi:hypothetical protein|nr:MAG: hypothetical protein C4557_13305 [Anaerolineaceae bacterium]